MITVEEELIDSITATFYYLLSGKDARPIEIPENLPDNEIRQLITYVNRFLEAFEPVADGMKHIARAFGQRTCVSVWRVEAGAMSFMRLWMAQSRLQRLTFRPPRQISV